MVTFNRFDEAYDKKFRWDPEVLGFAHWESESGQEEVIRFYLCPSKE